MMTFTQSNDRRVIRSGLRRPPWIGRNCRQLAIFDRDCSPSMSGQKAKDASQACFELVRTLALPENKDGFVVSVVDFSGNAKIKHSSVPAAELAQNLKPISIPLFGGGTNITAGLEQAEALCRNTPADAQDGTRWLRPVVVLFSDGCHNTGPGPKSAAASLRKSADVVAVAYGDDADVELLRGLATSPQHFYKCKDGSDLRQFFAAVGSTMTASLAAGVNATEALGQIQLSSERRTQ